MDDKSNKINDIDISSSTCDGTESELSEHMLKKLQDGMKDGFANGILDLFWCSINDSMLAEICGWIIKLGDKIKQLNLEKNEITSVGASQLLRTLKECNLVLSKLSLSGNQIDDSCMKQLGEYIQNNQHVEELYISHNRITDIGIEVLSGYLAGNTMLKHLCLGWNPRMTQQSLPSLVKIVESSHVYYIDIKGILSIEPGLIMLSLTQNIVKYGADQLKFPSLRINDDVIAKICEYMKKYGIAKLKEIDLRSNEITNKGAIMLFKTLKECNSIASHVDMSHNRIGNDCMESLGELVEDNEYLEDLFLDQNNLTDKDIEMLSRHLLGNIALKKLSISWNSKITEASSPYLLELAKSSYLNTIDTSFTGIPFSVQNQIDQMLNLPLDQREIPIKSNTKSATKISASA